MKKSPENRPDNDGATSPLDEALARQKRYRKTQANVPATKKFAQVFARTNNASEAVRQAFPDASLSPGSVAVKAHRLLRNDNVVADVQAQRRKLEALGDRAIHRIGELIESKDGMVAGQNARFVTEQVHGKATQKVESRSAHVFISYDLSGGQAGPVPQDVLDQLA